jgi:uncharacterized protein (UPF0276 family)
MKLAVNYSPQAAHLLNTGQIELDVFKCCGRRDVTQFVASRYPIVVHLPLRAGRGKLQQVDWADVKQVLKRSGTPYVNVYLAPYAPDFPNMSLDTIDPCWTEKIVAQMIADVNVVIKHFRPDQITLENAPWDPSPAYSIPRPAIEPEMISHIVREAGCGFSLDTAHARMAALHLEMTPVDYIDALPLEALRELSMTGVVYDETINQWRDHFAMCNEDWEIAEWVIERIAEGELPQPELVALEYGGVGPKYEWRSDSDTLLNDVSHLHMLLMEANMSLENQAQLAG